MYFDGDLAGSESARVLRLMGSLNYKYTPARLATIERYDLRWRLNVSEFDELLPVDPRATTNGRTAPLTPASTFQAGDCNGALFVSARRLRFTGFSYDETHAALTIFNRDRCRSAAPRAGGDAGVPLGVSVV